MGSNDQIISCHVLGCVDAMLVLGFIHAVGLLKLAVLVPVHAYQIILVFVCGMNPL